jgi:sterol desaturase/sphingolipid hydroxylase (fatty acid hydroxylase superfamily)
VDVALGLPDLGRPLVFAALAALIFVPLEHLFAAHPRRPRRRGLATDLLFATAGQALVRVGLVVMVAWALGALDRFALDRPLWSAIGDRRLRAVANVAAGLLLFELGGYAYHRLAHRIGWMWRLHEVHHSSESMDWAASFRQHPLELLLLTLAENAPLVLLGIPLGAHAAVLTALKLHTIFVHANIRVPAGPWGRVLAMPSFHHRHHGVGGTVDGASATRNFASLFPFLDMLFGTHSSETDTRRFGVGRHLPRGFLGLLLAPLRGRDA